MVYLIVAS